MKLDRTFARDIQKVANGDGSREARFAFLKVAGKAAEQMSSPDIMDHFDQVLQEYGRVAVGLCVAVTAFERKDRLNSGAVRWATAVLSLWTNRPYDILCLYIHDGLHPSRIEEYAGAFMKLTTEEA